MKIKAKKRKTNKHNKTKTKKKINEKLQNQKANKEPSWRRIRKQQRLKKETMDR